MYNQHHSRQQASHNTLLIHQEKGNAKHGVKGGYLEDNRSRTAVQGKLLNLMHHAHFSKQSVVQRKDNQTGMPNRLKAGLEHLSGYAMHDLRVHYNSSKPAQMKAHAYAQGSNIYLASGQEKHLPHEAWHVVQQKQGRVKPTVQMKTQVSINDDPKLEKEADIMGNKALNVSSETAVSQLKTTSIFNHTAAQPIQRKISIADTQYTVDELLLESPELAEDQTLRLGILPAWSALNKTFKDRSEFNQTIHKILNVYKNLTLFEESMPLSDFIQMQVFTQTFVKENAGDFEGLVTTVGFEHEFMQMLSGPLRGVTHLVIAESLLKMPMTQIGFFLETDASNALELVFPPLLVPTVGGTTLPDYSVVSAIDQLIKSHLLSLIQKVKTEANKNKSWLSFSVNGTMAHLVQQLSHVLGIQMNPIPNLTVTRENITQETDLSQLPADGQIPGAAVGAIEVGPSSKHKGGIDSQVNIAMDMHSAGLLDEAATFRGSDFSGALANLRRITTKLDKLLPTPETASPELQRFYILMRKKMASNFALESEKFMKAFQAERLLQMGQPQIQSDLSTLSRGEIETLRHKQDELAFHAMLSSIVKDTRSIWIKDHLVSIMHGLLNPQDRVQLLADLLEHKHIMVPIPAKFPEIYEAFNDSLQHAIANLIGYLTQSKSDLHPDPQQGPKVHFLEHDSSFIGARQDTYLSPHQVQMPAIWKRWLHVVELRKSNLDLLRIAYEKLTGKSAGDVPKAPEVTLKEYKPQDLDQETWSQFVDILSAEPQLATDHEDMLPLHAQVDHKAEALIDARKRGEHGLPESGMPKGSPEEEISESLPEEEPFPLAAASHTGVTSMPKESGAMKDEPERKDQYEHKESKKEKEKEPFKPDELKLTPNKGGGDCLYYALEGPDLTPITLKQAREEVASVRRQDPDVRTASNANQVALALYQSGVPIQVVRELTLGRHLVSNAAYAALQAIPGMYAGEEELIQWCALRGQRVAVVYQNGNVAIFSGEGRTDIPIDPSNRHTEILDALRSANLSLYKTPNHWERITQYRRNPV